MGTQTWKTQSRLGHILVRVFFGFGDIAISEAEVEAAQSLLLVSVRNVSVN